MHYGAVKILFGGSENKDSKVKQNSFATSFVTLATLRNFTQLFKTQLITSWRWVQAILIFPEITSINTKVAKSLKLKSFTTLCDIHNFYTFWCVVKNPQNYRQIYAFEKVPYLFQLPLLIFELVQWERLWQFGELLITAPTPATTPWGTFLHLPGQQRNQPPKISNQPKILPAISLPKNVVSQPPKTARKKVLLKLSGIET